jgi:hypothetical protein
MKNLSVLAIAMTAQASCGMWVESEDPSVAAAQGQSLVLTVKAAEHVAGVYRAELSGLRFDARGNGRVNQLAIARADGSPLFTALTGPDQVTISVMGRLEVSRPGSTTDPKSVQQAGDQTALAEFARTREFNLLPALSRALSSAGVDGVAFPATQPLLEMSSHAERMVATLTQAQAAARPTSADDEPTADGLVQRRICPVQLCLPEETWNEDTCSCEPIRTPSEGGGTACNPRQYNDLRSNPCGDDCRGMCGPKCTCWPWVCGNCAYNAGCAFHDDACDICYKSFGAAIPACAICLTPVAAFVASPPTCVR